MMEPLLTLSPNLTLMAVTTPAFEDGTSMEALSDSTVIRLCSAAMVSPTETMISMTSTSVERSEEHTSELQSLMRISYAVFCLKKKKTETTNTSPNPNCNVVL